MLSKITMTQAVETSTSVRHPLEMASKPTGEHFLFKKSAREGGKLEFVWTLAPGKRGPGEHVHPTEAETFRILSGTLRIWIDGEPRDLTAGEELAVPPGVRHKFFNPGTDPMVAEVTCDGVAMEDALVPLAIHIDSKKGPSFGDLARMMVHIGGTDASVPVSSFARGVMRSLAKICGVFGAAPFDVIPDWQARADRAGT